MNRKFPRPDGRSIRAEQRTCWGLRYRPAKGSALRYSPAKGSGVRAAIRGFQKGEIMIHSRNQNNYSISRSNQAFKILRKI